MGASAGAIVCNPTIKTAFWKGWDDPNAANLDFSLEENLKGGDLIPFHTFMHYDISYEDLVFDKSRDYKIDTSALKLIPDDCALFYDKNVSYFMLKSDGTYYV